MTPKNINKNFPKGQHVSREAGSCLEPSFPGQPAEDLPSWLSTELGLSYRRDPRNPNHWERKEETACFNRLEVHANEMQSSMQIAPCVSESLVFPGLSLCSPL